MARHDDDRSLDAEGIPDLETPINDDEGLIPPGDTPVATDEWGVTAVEERLQEPIAERVTREVPDVQPGDVDPDAADYEYGELRDGDAITGRFIDPGDDDVDDYDDEKDVIASLVGEDETAPSAEEAAMHITDLP